MKTKILLIDDDALVNLINKRIIEREYPEKAVYDFCTASVALNFLKENQNSENHRKRKNYRFIIFLDLNMPEINGWEFMEILEREFSSLHAQIYILTSSIDQNDKRKAEKYTAVHSFIGKPLTGNKLQELDLQPKKYSDQSRKDSLSA